MRFFKPTNHRTHSPFVYRRFYWLGCAALLLLSVGCRSMAASDATLPDSTAAELGAGDQQVLEADGETLDDASSLEANRDVFDAIAAQQVIYLGETHTSQSDHSAQLELIEALTVATQTEADKAEDKQIVIGLEMFQRPFQPVLDRYLAGEISEAELVAQSEYEMRWGYDWELYAPIIRYAKANQIPLIALNTPTEVTRQVVREGLASLSGDALTHIPPVEEIDTTDQAYRDSISAVFSAHGGAGHSLDFENFFAAQVLWDETMADSIARYYQKNPQSQIIVLVGKAHVTENYAIPDRVTRRIADDSFTQTVLLLPE